MDRSPQPGDKVRLKPRESKVVPGYVRHGGEATVIRTVDNGEHGLAVCVMLTRGQAIRMASPDQLVIHRRRK